MPICFIWRGILELLRVVIYLEPFEIRPSIKKLLYVNGATIRRSPISSDPVLNQILYIIAPVLPQLVMYSFFQNLSSRRR